MKKVAYFADFGSMVRTGGGQTFARELFAILDALPVELTVFSNICTPRDRELLLSSPKIKLIEVPFGMVSKPHVGLLWAWKLRSRLKKMPRQDLYVLDQPMTWLSILPKAPSVAMFHGSDYVRLSDVSPRHPRRMLESILWEKPVLNRLQKKFLEKKLGVPLFNSRHSLNMLGRDFSLPVEPLARYITHLPVNVSGYEKDEDARKETRARLGISHDEVLVIYLSNFAPVKQPGKIPGIVSGIFGKLPDRKVKFLFVGRGIASAPIDYLAKVSEFRDRCMRIEEVSPDEVRRLYSAADIALSTSKSESFGYFIAEGMSASLPFVAYRGGAIDEVIESGVTGYVVENEGEYIGKLTELIRNGNLRRKMGMAGYERVKSNFSREAFRDKFLKIANEEFHLGL